VIKTVTCRPDGEVDSAENNAFLTQVSVGDSGHLPAISSVCASDV